MESFNSVTLEPDSNVTFSREEHIWNTPKPNVSMVFGMITSFIFALPNAYDFMLVTVTPSILLGIVSVPVSLPV